MANLADFSSSGMFENSPTSEDPKFEIVDDDFLFETSDTRNMKNCGKPPSEPQMRRIFSEGQKTPMSFQCRLKFYKIVKLDGNSQLLTSILVNNVNLLPVTSFDHQISFIRAIQ